MCQWKDTYCQCIISRTTRTSIILATKKGDKNKKKGDEPKSEDKDNNNTGTAGAHVGETRMPQDSNAPSNGSSIGAHVSEVAKPIFASIALLYSAISSKEGWFFINLTIESLCKVESSTIAHFNTGLLIKLVLNEYNDT